MEHFLIGRKLGMTQQFDDKGIVTPCTVVEAGPCVVVQIKTEELDGYYAVVIAFEEIKKSRCNKPQTGIFKKANTTPKRVLREFRIDKAQAETIKLGDIINVETFAAGEIVDCTAKTKGRGYTGAIKRWNQNRGPMAHGSGYHRAAGSMGSNSDPSHVFKNKHMAGQYGNEQVTIQNLTIVKIDREKNCLFIKGGIPGPDGALVAVKSAIKRGDK